MGRGRADQDCTEGEGTRGGAGWDFSLFFPTRRCFQISRFSSTRPRPGPVERRKYTRETLFGPAHVFLFSLTGFGIVYKFPFVSLKKKRKTSSLLLFGYFSKTKLLFWFVFFGFWTGFPFFRFPLFSFILCIYFFRFFSSFFFCFSFSFLFSIYLFLFFSLLFS